MAPVLRTQGFVYRRGSRSDANFTPRPGRDTVGRPGRIPGLSTVESLQPGERGQKIDLVRLALPLRAWADDPGLGGTAGHVSIAPVDDAGAFDQQQLDDWAASRSTGHRHALTQAVLTAVVASNVRG